MSLTARLNGLARLAAQRTDVVIAAFMLMAVTMMIIPLPTALVDLLIGVNIALSILILIVAFYIGRAVELSALPPLILLSTLFRLSLSITTTRLILLNGDAGHIVKAFGNFVIAGEVVVGLVIFLIITVAQFVVITKGAERVAEVAARFTLDAMPGKQMSIDNDLRNGDIDQAQARLRRADLERESQLFGAMDGAMKFVKGDAIAGLVILAVNLIGGLLIGMLDRGMAFSEAVHTYSLLTVGDGLIAQIPALLIAVAAGTVVTRVKNEGSEQDLGSEIFQQLGSSARAMGLTAVILAGVSLLPGFPAVVFLSLALILGVAAFRLSRKSRPAPQEEPQETALVPMAAEAAADAPAPVPTVAPDSRVLLTLGTGLAAAVPPQPMQQRIEGLCHSLHAELGIAFPVPGMHVELAGAQDRFAIALEGVPVAEGEVPGGHLLLQDDPLHLELMSLPSLEATSPLTRRPARWVAVEHEAQLQQAGIGYLRPDELLRDVLDRTLRRYAGDFLGIQETRQMLERIEPEYGELIKEALRLVSLQRMAEALRALVEEGVSIRNQRALLEAMVEWGGRDADVVRLVEHLRAALARQISHQHADRNRVIAAWVLQPEAEERLRSSLRRLDSSREMLPEELVRPLANGLRQACDGLPAGQRGVLVVRPELRRCIRRLALREELDLSVLSYRELAPEYSLHALSSLELPQAPRPDIPSRSTTSLASAS
ncbi:EscV/YscV/HrcV family type III secretion system export apparatus protein [Stutzerimonas nosocomialis]|uniref:type III secretion system export apparatus subunit SctV n=1 Tax=Stutzerimonas nosocomialis TaxID=1056496 RepID=UPI001108FFA8|nr:type III secretion system export apparatus subunit SctV [Stutzerimonas nosocomialis]TLX58649.1 EscV/YscV/HrcV family type III secretion system export apparatus protein [Stutzerimonas nosocomialis]